MLRSIMVTLAALVASAGCGSATPGAAIDEVPAADPSSDAELAFDGAPAADTSPDAELASDDAWQEALDGVAAEAETFGPDTADTDASKGDASDDDLGSDGDTAPPLPTCSEVLDAEAAPIPLTPLWDSTYGHLKASWHRSYHAERLVDGTMLLGGEFTPGTQFGQPLWVLLDADGGQLGGDVVPTAGSAGEIQRVRALPDGGAILAGHHTSNGLGFSHLWLARFGPGMAPAWSRQTELLDMRARDLALLEGGGFAMAASDTWQPVAHVVWFDADGHAVDAWSASLGVHVRSVQLWVMPAGRLGVAVVARSADVLYAPDALHVVTFDAEHEVDSVAELTLDGTHLLQVVRPRPGGGWLAAGLRSEAGPWLVGLGPTGAVEWSRVVPVGPGSISDLVPLEGGGWLAVGSLYPSQNHYESLVLRLGPCGELVAAARLGPALRTFSAVAHVPGTSTAMATGWASAIHQGTEGYFITATELPVDFGP